MRSCASIAFDGSLTREPQPVVVTCCNNYVLNARSTADIFSTALMTHDDSLH